MSGTRIYQLSVQVLQDLSRVSGRMKFSFARLRNMRGIVEQPKVSVPVPTGPKAKKGFMMVSSHDVEIYPLVVCVSVGLGIGAYSLVRHIMSNPDVNLSRDRRETPAWERYKPEEGKAFSQNRHHLANLKPNPVNTFPEALKIQEDSK
ncbi:NADH-ubiquinone reductase complex 1 MLRQ subunit [Plasmopara halstedii]|uniref:NADH-ubiquinone reductase complex 1 MLRQ subunit n=1 Tax=Plasmopara halstedii TaxID=4781 RepID=A0A0P1APV8_PLAHL|nr:NADH-ubiquinone reductase complex 1 MLRQ subunit [Plasmopara halstedii]CEG43262.1 NADH-ubiquinone reductase complex 1 MLRQ subunit [Plasmopara halstedii]|eukprot:XP_024579631.1 NADH-ubiquinone reductase complex 1 MLRQ subunit [Plasmopara halstedii]